MKNENENRLIRHWDGENAFWEEKRKWRTWFTTAFSFLTNWIY